MRLTEKNLNSVDRAKTGIPGLDSVLNGGLIANRLYLIEGDPGAGKTTLSLQFLLEGMRNGERCLYITLSETKHELTVNAASHGWMLDGIEIMELVAEETDLRGDNHVTMFLPSEVELTETTKEIIQVVERVSPSRIVFDSLTELRLLAQSSLRYRRQIQALKQFFAGRNCTVLMLDDRSVVSTDFQVQSIAHGVIILEQLSPEYGAARRRMRVKKFRGTNFRGGYHDYLIGEQGLSVFPRLVAIEHNQDFVKEVVKSGVASLDAMLGGGPSRGTSTLLIGPAGSGKSTIAMQYAIAAAKRGEHAVVFAFDESQSTVEARLESLNISIGLQIEPGKVRFRQIDPAEMSPGEFAFLVQEAVETDHARVIVIDSLNGYLNSMPEERFLTALLHELLSYLGRLGVTTMMVVSQKGMMGSTSASPVDTSYLADSVILLRYFEFEGKVKKAISVLKKRSGSHEETIREIRFGKNGIQLSAPLTQLRGIFSGMPIEFEVKPDADRDE